MTVTCSSSSSTYILSHDSHLLELEDVVDKELLQVLIAEVDAELLKAVDLERLKPKDVQHSNRKTLLTTVLLGWCERERVSGFHAMAAISRCA